MNKIADFLRARYAERRSLAEATAADCGMRWSPGDEQLSSSVCEAESAAPVVIGPWEYLDWNVRRHIAANDPADVIADLDAKLTLVDELDAADPHGGYIAGTFTAYDALKLLAQPFAGHPDHKGEEWAP